MKAFNKGEHIFIRDNNDECYMAYNTRYYHGEPIEVKFLDDTKILDTNLGMKTMPLCEVTFNSIETDLTKYKMVYRKISKKKFINELELLK